ncbi:hypothetical protein AAON49_08800 [Pseudotenacibaculum sp. MALMAid0570]|uniref:hypothetical protein n=1 Tax=Pseudotenacibaculum sp. MALMAid0570 TaxID=3143938 RepID=UPI0032DF906A
MTKDLNYNLWKDYKNTEKIEFIGTIIDIKQKGIARSPKENFYIVKYKLDGKFYETGILCDYTEKDISLTKQAITRSENELTIRKIINSKVRLSYSANKPSYIRIVGFE